MEQLISAPVQAAAPNRVRKYYNKNKKPAGESALSGDAPDVKVGQS